MIPDEIRRKFLAELEKSGNVYFACNKAGIHRSTFYRWKKENKKFKRSAEDALRIGRENICDLAEHALLLNVKEKKMDAIKYVLSHHSDIYKPKRTSKVVIEHRSTGKGYSTQPESKGLEDILRESEERMTNEYLRLLNSSNHE